MSHALRAATPVERSSIVVTELRPGTNRRDELSRADWRFLLPGLQFENVLFLGIPARGALVALAATARRVVVAAANEQRLAGVRRAMQQRGLLNVHPVLVTESEPLPFSDGCLGLLVIDGRGRRTRRYLSGALTNDAIRVLRSDGMLYCETTSLACVLLARRLAASRIPGGAAATQLYWLAQGKGAMRAALPLTDMPTLSVYFFRHVLYGRSRVGRALVPLARALARLRLLRYVIPARAVVVTRQSNPSRRNPPFSYLTKLAQRNGVDIAGHRKALLPGGAYDSNKVAVFLFDRSARIPDAIIKMTRATAFNDRLESEYRALVLLHEMKFVAAGTYPEALFLDYHDGLAVLGQKVVHGSPFRVRTTSEVTCPCAHDAIQWIIGLGAASANATADAPQLLAQRLQQLLDRTTQVYALSRSEQSFLSERIAALAGSRAALPLVFRHGDAGTWNVLVTEQGRAAFLDWEVSEAHGPPLWDLFDFIRSFGTWIGRRASHKDAVANYEKCFLQRSPLSELQLEMVTRYCTQVGVARSFVEPLFYACWMQRALREAAWTPGALEKGSYIQLLRLCVRRHDSPGLRWLFN